MSEERSERSDDFLSDPTLLQDAGYDDASPQSPYELAGVQRAEAKRGEGEKRVNTRRRSSLKDTAGRVNSSINRVHVSTAALVKTATSLLAELQRLDKEVSGLIRQVSAGDSPEDAAAASELHRLRTLCATNARLASGAMGAYRRMSNLKNFQLIVD